MEVSIAIIFLGSIIFLAHLFSELYARTRIPDVLLLFLIGLLIGPIFKIVTPAHLGSVGPVFATITLILILFESGISLSLEISRGGTRNLIGLTIVSFFANVIVVASLAYVFTKLKLIGALILGAIVGGTSSPVIIPILEKIKMGEEAKTTLVFESIFNDVLCIVLTYSFISAYFQGEVSVLWMGFKIPGIFLLSSFVGGIFALLWAKIVDKVGSFPYPNFTTIAFVFIIFGIAELIGLNGGIVALVFGYVFNNVTKGKIASFSLPLGIQNPGLNEVGKSFLREIVFLLKTFFFIYMGISIQLTNIWSFILGLVIIAMLFILRLFVVKLVLSKNISRRDAKYMAVVIPKGLAAAVLATIPVQKGIPEGVTIQNLTYSIVLFSIIVSSILTGLIETQPLKGLYDGVLGKKFKSEE